MSGRSQILTNEDWLYEKSHMKQTLFSVEFNFVLCIVVSLLLLSLLLHVEVFKNDFELLVKSGAG